MCEEERPITPNNDEAIEESGEEGRDEGMLASQDVATTENA